MNAPELVDPELFLAIDDLELATRSLVDSVLSGAHRSDRTGPGAEFAQHRDYQPGDDLRHINWRLFSRTRRLYVREFRAETSMPVYVVVDASASMRIGQPHSKLRYATRVAAALAYLALRGRDAVGLRIARGGAIEVLPARATFTQFGDILAKLDTQIAGGAGDLGAAIDELCETCRKRGTVFILSDFADGETALLSGLSTLREMGHDVSAVQILAPFEECLPATGDFDFFDPESGTQKRAAADLVRDGYARAVRDWRQRLSDGSDAIGTRWTSITTASPLEPLLGKLTMLAAEVSV
ncbi:MAG: DUF58 domain-containing protein [Chthoniobacteraceae bacterium]